MVVNLIYNNKEMEHKYGIYSMFSIIHNSNYYVGEIN